MLKPYKMLMFQAIICVLLIWLACSIILLNRTVQECAQSYQHTSEMVYKKSMDHIGDSIRKGHYESTNFESNKAYASKHRHITNNIEEFWFYIQSEVSKLKAGRSGTGHSLDQILDMTSQFKRSLMTNMQELKALQGGDRETEAQNKRMGDLVQARLRHIQNPRDCASAKKVSCRLNWSCGFGCQLHHVAYCLIIAYATNRTLVLNSDGWNYHSGGLEAVFEPLSQTCRTVSDSDSVAYWPNHDPERQTIVLASQTYSWKTSPGPRFIPRSVPKDIAAGLSHGEPIVWWVGQIVSYIFKPNTQLRALLSAHAEAIGFTSPVVGVHIRRSDKVGTEAAAHSVHEYMRHVVEYYDQLSLRTANVTRRVYVATDDHGVIAEIRAKYPRYTVLGDGAIAKAAGLGSRYSEAGLLGIVTDLWFLARSDYLVCTFSSQICRVAYELMNSAAPGDASLNYKSLDDIWFFAGQLGNTQVVLEDHTPQESGQIELRVGDRVRPAGNHWDGFSLGTNERTKKTGLYPSFKVTSWGETYEFPMYPEVKVPQR